jgi:hypothetical protein
MVRIGVRDKLNCFGSAINAIENSCFVKDPRNNAKQATADLVMT